MSEIKTGVELCRDCPLNDPTTEKTTFYEGQLYQVARNARWLLYGGNPPADMPRTRDCADMIVSGDCTNNAYNEKFNSIEPKEE